MQQLGQCYQQIVKIGSAPQIFVGTVFHGTQNANQRGPRVVAMLIDRQQQGHQIKLEIDDCSKLLLIQPMDNCFRKCYR